MEWDAAKYDPSASFARYWNTVLVRTPDDAPDSDPRFRTFRSAAASVHELAHRGRFWLFDASDLGTPPAGTAGFEPEPGY